MTAEADPVAGVAVSRDGRWLAYGTGRGRFHDLWLRSADPNVVVLPRYVLRADHTILTANADNELEILPVTVLRAEPKKVYLSQGIEGGTKVVITTLDAPVPGTKLAIRGLEEPTATESAGSSEQ